MNKEFIPYEQALALKKLGFDEPCFGSYDEKSVFGLTIMSIKQYYSNSKEDTWNCAAPLYQQAFRWFRDKKLCDGSVCRHGDADGSYSYRWDILCEYGVYEHRHFKQDYKTHEEAELECLKKLIEIVKGGEQ